MVFLSVSVSVTVSAGSVRSVCESMPMMFKPASVPVCVHENEKWTKSGVSHVT